jgi:hypothetical protein
MEWTCLRPVEITANLGCGSFTDTHSIKRTWWRLYEITDDFGCGSLIYTHSMLKTCWRSFNNNDDFTICYFHV